MLDSFLKYLKYEKRYSRHTIDAYERDVKQAFLYFHYMYEVKSPAEVTHPMVRSWVVSLVTDKQLPRSINRKISSLRAYYKFLRRDGTLEHNPVSKVQSLKLPKRLPQYLQEGQAKDLIESLDWSDDIDFRTLRNNLIVLTLYYTGMRRSELIGLRVGDVDVGSRQVRVVGKGNKVRLIPLTPHHVGVIKRYLDLREQEHPEGDYLFVTDQGNKFYPKLVYNIVSKHVDMISTLSHKGPHTLRHTFATHLSSKGADLNAIKDLLGHANLNATQIYTHNSIEKLKAAYQKAHPKAD